MYFIQMKLLENDPIKRRITLTKDIIIIIIYKIDYYDLYIK